MVVIIILFPLVLLSISILFSHFRCVVINYLGKQIPYSLGLGVLIGILVSFKMLQINSLIIFAYFIVLWLTGFVDDYFGAKYPKGLKGHFFLFLQAGKISTGLLKLMSTTFMAAIVAFYYNKNSILDGVSIFLLLTMAPHVMNLFDTRPLRVWKIVALHLIIFIPMLLQIQIQIKISIFIMVASLIYFEGSRKAMLGDNGATLLGGIVSVIAIEYFSLFLQWLLIGGYLFIILAAERISLTEWIERRPVLKRIDRWGVL